MIARQRRLILAVAATLAVVVPLGWLWQQSLLPDTYSVMSMGHLDTGGGPGDPVHGGHGSGPAPSGGRSVATLVADPARTADVRVTVVARKERFTLASGADFDGYTLNGSSPGPVIRAVQGQLLEVRLVNESVPDGAALHWHGVDVPAAMDGVAGVTQDAVPMGGSFVYRFVVDQVGTYWYHSHQVSHVQVQRGLFGALVVSPPTPLGPEQLAVMHVYGGVPTVNGGTDDVQVVASPGTRVRVRVVNTDNAATLLWTSGGAYRLLAVDGYDVNAPTPVVGRALRLTAGGRADLEVTSPARVELGGTRAVVVGSPVPVAAQPRDELDLLGYGSPAPIGFDPAKAARDFEYSLGRRPGFVDGRPGVWWSINGRLFPDVPMFLVAEGDVVRMRIENHSREGHPMHLHGHHAVVLSRNGVAATGSPWWVDSLDVADGDSYEVAFLADNPGVWMDHCHNLPHAAEGLVAHLAYVGVTTPFRVGGKAGNAPE